MLLRLGEASKDRLDLEVIFLGETKGALGMILPWFSEMNVWDDVGRSE
jgi:hypothetical protein